MLLVKLGILAFLGKGYYSAFLFTNLYLHTTNIIKSKLNKKLEVIK